MQESISAHAGHEHGHVDEDELKILGFWIFLVTDCLLFATFFSAYAVLHSHTNGGFTAKDFDIPGFIIETFVLLVSSFTSGLAVLQMHKGNKKGLIGWLIVTAALGAVFVALEINEFTSMALEGATLQKSAFLTSFFSLVGTHGCHVTFGIFWMAGLIVQLSKRGITTVTKRKISIISLYWHFLDAVWIFIFTVVYLMGVM
ncbi:cytochrome (ubi)quinol oxidase subunit III [Bacillus sp. EB600]|uniref:cytochrome (ubi)quinol oxidase subunit III n=1 Tax=Bacillus sp. EB600 TaxID=2806345 RepID=UPI00210D53FA|nr:cytochrome (ubi)quinol oxidase subunit III [Bacillus sp. EB600]MCQ6281355.1 cytochrome (ubi)quinol oxidase subunit III [Bacillus sp. EB600]